MGVPVRLLVHERGCASPASHRHTEAGPGPLSLGPHLSFPLCLLPRVCVAELYAAGNVEEVIRTNSIGIQLY